MLGQNLRFLMWCGTLSRDIWVREVAGVTGLRVLEAQELLFSDTAPLPIAEKLAEHLGVSTDELLHADMLRDSGKSVLRENLEYLLKERGAKKRIAEALGIQPMSVSKWINGTNTPSRSNLLSLLTYLGFSASLDLTEEPIFLDPSPASSLQQRKWLIDRIEQIDARELSQYFPVLQKLLSY